QNREYAGQYRAIVERVRRVEVALLGDGEETKLSTTVARTLFKLMANKDEYEVARLYSSGRFMSQLRDTFEGDFKLQFHLAPPMLIRRDPETGELRKRVFGAWMMPVFSLLAKFKCLRGSRFDIFSYSDERRQERQLLADFNNDLSLLLANLRPDNFDMAIELVSLVEDIRGFGHVKQHNIDQYQIRRAKLLARYTQQTGQAVELRDVRV
ncbi:MAG: DUF6537 domain-containing protein, partial [Spongiibacteraceae bacterium]